jgi:hypothetical protein
MAFHVTNVKDVNDLLHVRFQVFMAASMKMTVFWNVVLCTLVVDQRFRGAYCLRYQGFDGDITQP